MPARNSLHDFPPRPLQRSATRCNAVQRIATNVIKCHDVP